MGSCAGKSAATADQPIVMQRNPYSDRPASKEAQNPPVNQDQPRSEAEPASQNPNPQNSARGQPKSYSNDNPPPKAEKPPQQTQAAAEKPKDKESMIDEDAEAVFVQQLNKRTEERVETKPQQTENKDKEVMALNFPNPAFGANAQQKPEVKEVKQEDAPSPTKVNAERQSLEKPGSRSKQKNVTDILNNPDGIENEFSSPEPINKRKNNTADDDEDFDV